MSAGAAALDSAGADSSADDSAAVDSSADDSAGADSAADDSAGALDSAGAAELSAGAAADVLSPSSSPPPHAAAKARTVTQQAATMVFLSTLPPHFPLGATLGTPLSSACAGAGPALARPAATIDPKRFRCQTATPRSSRACRKFRPFAAIGTFGGPDARVRYGRAP